MPCSAEQRFGDGSLTCWSYDVPVAGAAPREWPPRPGRGTPLRATSRIDHEAYMSISNLRALAGAFALLAGAAVLDVSGVLAQQAPDDSTFTSTSCGVGTLSECGREDIKKCSWKFEFHLDPRKEMGGITIGVYDCKDYGFKALYKDRNGTSEQPPSCYGGGSRGTGLPGTRGSGDELEEDNFCF